MHHCELAAVKDGYCARHHPDYVPPSLLVHLHDEQFDGWLHAACGALDAEPPHALVEIEDEFYKLRRSVRCPKCSRLAFPHGETPPTPQTQEPGHDR